MTVGFGVILVNITGSGSSRRAMSTFWNTLDSSNSGESVSGAVEDRYINLAGQRSTGTGQSQSSGGQTQDFSIEGRGWSLNQTGKGCGGGGGGTLAAAITTVAAIAGVAAITGVVAITTSLMGNGEGYTGLLLGGIASIVATLSGSWSISSLGGNEKSTDAL